MADSEGNHIYCYSCEVTSAREHSYELNCPQCMSSFVEIIEIPPEQDQEQEQQLPEGLLTPVPGWHLFSAAERQIERRRQHQQAAADSFDEIDRAVTPPPRRYQHFDLSASYLSDPGGEVGLRTSNEGEPAYGADFFWFPLNHPARYGDHLVREHATMPQARDERDVDDMIRPPQLDIRLLVEQFRQELSSNPTQASIQNPFARLSALFNVNQNGDAVYSQEEFDRVMSAMIQTTTTNGAPPAPASAIQSLPKKRINPEMLGTEGTAECSICMDRVELGTEVVVLPCKHWFHYNCIESWLNQHNTCPHCRRSIGAGENSGTRENPVEISSSPVRPVEERRRSFPFSIRSSLSNRSSRSGHTSTEADESTTRRPSSGRFGTWVWSTLGGW